jgi:hypothetical protein
LPYVSGTHFGDPSTLLAAVTYGSVVGRLSNVVRTHRRRLLHAIMLLVALAAMAPLVGVDPGMLALLLDADFLLLAGAVGFGLLRSDLRVLAYRLGRALPVLWVRVGVEMTREAPLTVAGR